MEQRDPSHAYPHSGDAGVAKPVVVEAKGLDAKDNDPAVVALAKAALACPRGGDELFDTKCSAYTTWADPKRASADATSVNLLDDADERVRFLGATALKPEHPAFVKGEGVHYQFDRALAGRLIAAAAKEPSETVAVSLGARVARIDVEKTGALEPIIAMVKARKHVRAVREVIQNVLFSNSRHRPTYDFMIGMTKDPDDKLQGPRSEELGFHASNAASVYGCKGGHGASPRNGASRLTRHTSGRR